MTDCVLWAPLIINFLFGSSTVINMACVLDPRFKLNFMEEADSIKRQIEQHLILGLSRYHKNVLR